VSQSSSRRKYLSIIIVMCLLIVAVGFTPTIQQRMAALPGARSGGSAAAEPGLGDASEVAGSSSASALGMLPPAGASGEIPLPDAERIVQQAQLIRGELAARERAIAAQEDLLRRQVRAEFWKRQAAAAAATLGLSLMIVLVLVRRAADWSGFSQRLREEESRMRNLQLSVIGALEEFESELAAARSWAAAEARSRRPMADRSPLPELIERPAEGVVLGAGPAAPGQTFFATRPAAAHDGAAGPSGFFFGEDEHVGAAVPLGSSDARRQNGETDPANRFDVQVESRSAGMDLAAPTWASNESAAAPMPEPPMAAVQPPAREAAFQEPWRPAQGAAAPSAAVARPGPAPSALPGSPVARSGPAPAAPQPVSDEDGQQSWARRFFAPEPPEGSAPAAPAAAAPNGPWVEPVRREAPTPAPKNPPRYGTGGPSTREQVERLTAEGWSETEIARRLGLSREEIHLALMLGRSARAEAPANTPFGRGPVMEGPGTVPPPGWQQRERTAEGMVGR
jgi:hypothetical protein